MLSATMTIFVSSGVGTMSMRSLARETSLNKNVAEIRSVGDVRRCPCLLLKSPLKLDNFVGKRSVLVAELDDLALVCLPR
jgi:hypothetical protein